MKESDNILRILKETKVALSKQDNILLKGLSNQTIHTASMSQDPENIAIAVVVYSLSKIIERQKIQNYSGWKKFYGNCEKCFDNLIQAIQKKDNAKFMENIALFRKSINKLSGNLKTYMQDVFRKASINKASRIYEHGISMERTASLLGITMFELANYAGQTGISDVKESKTISVKQRIKFAEEIFG